MDPKETESQVEKKNRRMRAAKESANLKMKINLRNENSPRIIEQNDDIGEKNDDLTGDLLDDDGKSIIEIDEDAAALNKEITNHFENEVMTNTNFHLNESYQWDEDDVFSRTYKEIRRMPSTQKKSILSKLENLIQESNSGNSLHRRESLESSNSNQHFFDKKRQRERISSVPEGYRPPNFYNQGPPNDSYYQWLMHQQMMHQFNPNIPLAERYDEKEPFTEFAIRFRTKLRFIYIPEAFLKDYLKLHLSGRPLRECNDNDDLDFEETMQFLTRNFRGSLSADSAYRRIKLIKCTDPKDFEKYCKEIDNLCNIAYADESRKRLLERKKHHILELLPENLRIILKYSNLINTVEDLIVAGKDVWRVNKFQKKEESVKESDKDDVKPTKTNSYCGKPNHDDKEYKNKLRDEQKEKGKSTTIINSCIIDETPTSEITKLPCVQVELNDSIKTIALIDSSSQRTIIPYELAQELDVKLSDGESRCTTFNNHATNLKKAKDYIKIKLSKDYNVSVTPLIADGMNQTYFDIILGADVIMSSETKFEINKNVVKIRDDSEVPLIYPHVSDENFNNRDAVYIYSTNHAVSKGEFKRLTEDNYPDFINKSKLTRKDQEKDIKLLKTLKLTIRIPEDKEKLILVQIPNKKDGQENWVPYVPKEMVNIVLKFAHEFYGHQKWNKVTELLLNKCYFIEMKRKIKKYIKKNNKACLSEDTTFHRKPLVSQTTEPNTPTESLCIDTIGTLTLPNSKSNIYCESTNKEIMRNTAKMYEIIRDTISSERQKAVDYQIKTGNIMNETNLRKGTLIMIQRGKSSKFDSEFIGPTEVILDNGDSVQIRHPETKRLTTVHKEQIKLLKNQSQAQMGE